MASVLLRYIFLKTFNKVILSHKKSYSTLQAKQATFTNWVDKSSLKTPKQVLQLSFLSHFMHQTKHFCIQGRFFILQHWWSSEIFATRPWSLFQRIGNGFINVGWHRISSAGVWLRLRFDNCSISLRWPIKKDKRNDTKWSTTSKLCTMIKGNLNEYFLLLVTYFALLDIKFCSPISPRTFVFALFMSGWW